jgi:hypothetical protein
MVTKEQFLKDYILANSTTLLSLRLKGLLAKTLPLEFNIHSYKPGDYILIKTWKEDTLQPSWEEQYHVLLTTEIMVRTTKNGWTHYTRIKILPKVY